MSFGHSIKQRTFVAAPPEKVYDTITSASEWDKFFTTGMTLDPAVGGKCLFRWKDWGPDFYSVEADGDVLAADRPDRFAFKWYSCGREHPTTITFSLEAKYGGTVLTIEESGHPDTERGRAMIVECASGWGEAATLLKFYLEHGVTYTPPERDRG
jgi:uncharacterized protein YndB with AHSA1/START domain